MGVCIDKLPHSCGTTKGLQVFADEEKGTVNGWCYACGTFVANPYGSPKTIDEVDLPEPKTQAEIEAELLEVTSLPFVDVRKRKLRKQYLEEFGTRVSLSEEDGETPTAMYHPITKGGEVTGYYVKTLTDPSHTWSIGDVKNGEPFNWQNARKSGAWRLIIVEGKEDAIAVAAIADRYGDEKYKPAVIALPNGTQSTGSLTPLVQEITRRFKEVVVIMDDDKAGHAAESKILTMLPQALTVRLAHGDPNQALMDGAGQATYKEISFTASKAKNTRLITAGTDLHMQAREPTPFGELTWPYPTMNKLLRNIRLGETIYIGAGVKMGKSELVNDIAAHLMKEGHKVFLAKPEEAVMKTYKMIAGKMVGKVFHDPEIEFDYEAYDRAGDMIGDKLTILDLYQHAGWETLKSDIIAAASYGVKAVFIDPITNLTNGVNSADANTKLQEIAQDLAAMAKDLNIVVFIFCHLKAPEGNISKDQREKKYREGQYTQLGNCPHEFGGDVMSSQFSGSRAMMRSCNLMLGLEGNKDPNLDKELRNQRIISILEDREFGNSARIPLYWNDKTTHFQEI